MSNGGIGGGVASAIARAIGAGRMDDADALSLHALVAAVRLRSPLSTMATGIIVRRFRNVHHHCF
jgi:hypothetical protein